jgi:hypothetical protein
MNQETPNALSSADDQAALESASRLHRVRPRDARQA